MVNKFDNPRVQEFYEYLKPQNEMTAYNYARDVQRLIDFTGEEPEGITAQDVRNFFGHRRKRGDSDRSVNRYSHALKRFFDLIGRNRLTCRIEEPEYTIPEPNWIESIEKIRELIEAGGFEEKAVLSTGYELAMRPGEIPKLRVEEFSPEAGEINVRRLKHRSNPNEYILPVRDWCVRILQEWIDHRESNSARIFPFTPQTASDIFKRTAEKIRLPDEYTFHCLRHSRITHKAIEMIRSTGSVDKSELGEFAGHLKPESTRRYIRLASEFLALDGK